MTVPMTRILIADRGEISLRIHRTCRALGIHTVAIASADEATVPHALAADELVILEPRSSELDNSSVYADIEGVLEAAKNTGCEAVHPGYGPLAESPEFAAACESAWIEFIGPPAQALAACAQKLQTKALARELSIPVIDGPDTCFKTPDAVRDELETRPLPVVLKPNRGGGGIGIRRVTDLAQLESGLSDVFASAGEHGVFVENELSHARHIEVQILADQHGEVRHLWERDCSVQRRQQKLIEEAPAIGLEPGLRDQLHRSAEDLARALGIIGVATVEFLVRADGDFRFMEVNPRLQVEHPVTEAITGIDLVRAQIEIAEGRPIEFRTDDVIPEGHAIECRLCAEDPCHDFVPSTGRVALWQPPAQMRCDTALAPGIRISRHFDSMQAKLVAHATDRRSAARRLAHGLRHTRWLGVIHNIGFLSRVLESSNFLDRPVTTQFSTEHIQFRQPPRLDRSELRILAAAVVGIEFHADLAHDHDWPGAAHRRETSEIRPLDASLPPGAVWRSTLARDGRVPGRWRCQDEAGEYLLGISECHSPSPSLFRLTVVIDGMRHIIDASRKQGHIELQNLRTGQRVLQYQIGQHGLEDRGETSGHLLATMPGRVVEVHVSADELVARGSPLVTIEAMKMRNTLSSPHPGKIAALYVSPGDEVEREQALLTVAEVPLGATLEPGREPDAQAETQTESVEPNGSDEEAVG